MANIYHHGSTWHDEPHAAIPARFRRIRERAAAKDRNWFRVHPDETHYVRPYLPGEFWPSHPPASVDVVVLVTQMRPGMRTRRPLAHVVRRPGNRMTVVDLSSESILRDVPMEGWSDA